MGKSMEFAYFLNMSAASGRKLLIHRQDCIFGAHGTIQAMLGKHSSASTALAKAHEDYAHYEIVCCEKCCNE